MTTQENKQKDGLKVKALMVLTAMLPIVGFASATSFDLNASIYPIINGVTLLIPTIIALIIAIVPAIIILAVVGFIVKFFDEVIGMLKL